MVEVWVKEWNEFAILVLLPNMRTVILVHWLHFRNTIRHGHEITVLLFVVPE